MVPVLFLLWGLNLRQDNLKMKVPEPWKMSAFLWHSFSDHHLISKLYRKIHIGSLIFFSDDIFLIVEFIFKLNSSSFWSIPVSITAIITLIILVQRSHASTFYYLVLRVTPLGSTYFEIIARMAHISRLLSIPKIMVKRNCHFIKSLLETYDV